MGEMIRERPERARAAAAQTDGRFHGMLTSVALALGAAVLCLVAATPAASQRTARLAADPLVGTWDTGGICSPRRSAPP